MQEVLCAIPRETEPILRKIFFQQHSTLILWYITTAFLGVAMTVADDTF